MLCFHRFQKNLLERVLTVTHAPQLQVTLGGESVYLPHIEIRRKLQLESALDIHCARITKTCQLFAKTLEFSECFDFNEAFVRQTFFGQI